MFRDCFTMMGSGDLRNSEGEHQKNITIPARAFTASTALIADHAKPREASYL